MNEELMKKAYEDLDGVWPNGYTALIVSTYRNSVWGGGKYDNYSLGKDVFEQSRSNPLSWNWVGTKYEFEAYGESLKKEWMPEVGEECLVSIRESNFNKCLVMGFFGDLVWVNLHLYDGGGVFSGSHVSLCKSDIKFLPIKSEREKKIEMVLDLLSKDVDPSYYSVRDWVEMVVDAGFINAPSS